jgi:predicted RNA-binding protein with PUA-like domain
VFRAVPLLRGTGVFFMGQRIGREGPGQGARETSEEKDRQISGGQSFSSEAGNNFDFAARPLVRQGFSLVTKAIDTRGHWLVKQEPESYSWEDFAKDRRTSWDGVRNYQARNNLRGMRPGDPALFYSSGESKAVVGIARVSKAAYPDPTADEPAWVSVELEAVKPLKRAVTLAEIKANPALAGVILVRHSRLSVMPLAAAEFERIVRLGG